MSVTFRNEDALLYFINYMESKGITKNGIYSLLANIYAESGFVLNNLQNSGNNSLGISDEEYTRQVDVGMRNFLDSKGYGWCQWTSSGRKNGLYLLAKSKGLSIASKEVQTEYIYQELSKSYKSVLKYLFDVSKTLEECTIKVMVSYEAPANKNKESYQQKRVGYAKEIAEHFEEKKGVYKMKFVPMKTRPLANDKNIALYNNAQNGGLSKCITGHTPEDRIANVLPNCVGFSSGRFNSVYNDMTGNRTMKYDRYCNHANTFVSIADSYGHKHGMIPQLGAIMCWSGGTSKHGHVCNVEEIVNADAVYVSESSWTERTIFKYRKRTRLLGSWSVNPTYKFLGFIYNPALYTNPFKLPTDTLVKGVKGEEVMWLQHQLKLYGYDLVIDGSFGGKTDSAVRDFQANNLGVDGKKLTVDGKVGKGTRTALMNNYLKH